MRGIESAVAGGIEPAVAGAWNPVKPAVAGDNYMNAVAGKIVRGGGDYCLHPRWREILLASAVAEMRTGEAPQ